MNEIKEQKTNWVMIFLWLALGLIILGLALWFRPTKADASINFNWQECHKYINDVCYDKSLPICNNGWHNGACYHPTPTPTPTPEPVYVGYCSENSCMQMECDWDNCESECKTDEDCLEPTPEVTPTVTPEPTSPPVKTESKPEGCTENCGVPACTDQTPQPVVNPHVYRSGDCAIVKYWPTSDKVNLYWKQVSSGDWQYSLANQPATGNHDVCGLGTMDITFGVQSVSGCAADGVVNASNLSVIVDGNACGWTLYR